jgi:hypothetical protein
VSLFGGSYIEQSGLAMRRLLPVLIPPPIGHLF